ncbi:uncharacterized protein [Littorina saxatilis]|uniref:uncharacterized protein isoform X1 n=1 Tax=Littorina saxatilis TaxID=31220 RepID=UPI0038B689AF
MDHGGENLDVVALMNEHRGEGRGSAMQGRSDHNQRIECLWLDVWKDVVNPYHDLFTAMGTPQAEGGLGILNMDNPIHLWALHYVFLPRLNRSLQWIVEQKNHQPLRTERNRTPLQLFFRGMLERRASTSTAEQDFWKGRSLQSIIEDHPLPDSR